MTDEPLTPKDAVALLNEQFENLSLTLEGGREVTTHADFEAECRKGPFGEGLDLHITFADDDLEAVMDAGTTPVGSMLSEGQTIRFREELAGLTGAYIETTAEVVAVGSDSLLISADDDQNFTIEFDQVTQIVEEANDD